jgi:pimeloyl-ACP methyl ester carboxylesterase
LLGTSEGGTLSALFAATYPERVEALIIDGSTARWADALGRVLEFMNEYFDSTWGSGDMAAVIASTLSADEGVPADSRGTGERATARRPGCRRNGALS